MRKGKGFYTYLECENCASINHTVLNDIIVNCHYCLIETQQKRIKALEGHVEYFIKHQDVMKDSWLAINGYVGFCETILKQGDKE